nr:RNA methyltransferase [Fusibacter paucivorans]
MHHASLDVLKETDRFVVYLDRIQDPGNLGTIIRTADAAGVDAIVLNRGCVDVFNSKVLRSTAGSILNVRLIHADSDDAAISALRQKQFKMIVTDLQSDFDYNDNRAYREKNCLVIGNEGSGVSEKIKAEADVRISIPIYGKAESLNASIAAGILIYKIKSIL